MMVMDDFFTSDSLTDLDQPITLGKDIDFKDEMNELRSESMQSHIQETKQKSMEFDPH